MKTTKFTPDQSIINANSKVINMMPKDQLQSAVTTAAEVAYGKQVPRGLARQITAASKTKLCVLYANLAALIKKAQEAPEQAAKKTSKKEVVEKVAAEPTPQEKRIANAQERLQKYTKELGVKEKIKNPEKEVKLRIASLHRKIARATAALAACNVAIS